MQKTGQEGATPVKGESTLTKPEQKQAEKQEAEKQQEPQQEQEKADAALLTARATPSVRVDLQCQPNQTASRKRKRPRVQTSLEGRGVVCLPPVGSWWSGHFIGEEQQFGLLAKERDIDECLKCADGGYAEYTVEVLDFKRSMLATCIVRRSGGNVVCLASDQLNFQTETMKCEEEATELIHRLFPEVGKQASAEVKGLLFFLICSCFQNSNCLCCRRSRSVSSVLVA